MFDPTSLKPHHFAAFGSTSLDEDDAEGRFLFRIYAFAAARQLLVRSHSSENHQILEIPPGHDSRFSPAFTPKS